MYKKGETGQKQLLVTKPGVYDILGQQIAYLKSW